MPLVLSAVKITLKGTVTGLWNLSLLAGQGSQPTIEHIRDTEANTSRRQDKEL